MWNCVSSYTFMHMYMVNILLNHQIMSTYYTYGTSYIARMSNWVFPFPRIHIVHNYIHSRQIPVDSIKLSRQVTITVFPHIPLQPHSIYMRKLMKKVKINSQVSSLVIHVWTSSLPSLGKAIKWSDGYANFGPLTVKVVKHLDILFNSQANVTLCND